MNQEWVQLARQLDTRFPSLRHQFKLPTFRSCGLDASNDQPVTYLCGNSLGLMPIATRDAVNGELTAWADLGVQGHFKRFDGADPWVRNDELVAERLGKLIFGCSADEVRLTGTLTGNLNALMQAFYKPDSDRYKILYEQRAFPSDDYSFQSQVELHGYTPEQALILAGPRPGEHIIRTEDVLDLLKKHGKEISVICLPAIQFYTGQYFDIPTITKAAHDEGCIVGWDLAHASGNVPLKLHEWGVDFAVFCSYKYLNCGPGNIGGLFVHSDFAAKFASEPRPMGWWGVDVDIRFQMAHKFTPSAGARGFCQSNLNFLGPACMNASLDSFEEAGGVSGLTSRRKALVSFLERLLKSTTGYGDKFVIMTDGLGEDERGTQLSLLFSTPDLMQNVFLELGNRGVIADERPPCVIRFAPVALYNTFEDVAVGVSHLDDILSKL